MSLTNKALLAQLLISQWTARKLDKRVTREVASNHNVAENVGRYNRSLLPGNEKLKEIHQLTSKVRQQFYANTLPWGIEGTHILPSANYMSFMGEFRQAKGRWEALVNEFVDLYHVHVADAELALGNLFNRADYPHDIRSKFRFEMNIMPVPDADFRVEVGDAELRRIQQEVEARVTQAANTGIQAAWQRLLEKVEHFAEKLGDPKAIFRDSMVENARELCDMLTRLNFSDDPNLEAMRREVESKLAVHHPHALRNDLDLRRKAASDAADIAKRMGAFMGGVK